MQRLMVALAHRDFSSRDVPMDATARIVDAIVPRSRPATVKSECESDEIRRFLWTLFSDQRRDSRRTRRSWLRARPAWATRAWISRASASTASQSGETHERALAE